VHGDCAVITGQARIELLSEGKPKTLNSAFTNVWIKGPKGWQMVAWQSTPLAA
jgi:ketosteroid isomerase-like protein